MGLDRLKCMVSFVKKHSIVADIGTDHGIIPVSLIEKGISKKVIATDISEKSIQKLQIKLNAEPNLDSIEIRIANGLDALRLFEVDTIMISGMGGFLIKDILEENIDIAKSANTLILGPNNGNYELRKFLIDHNFEIIEEEDLFENGIYYQIMKVMCGKDFYEYEYEYEFGKKLIENKSPHLLQYLKMEIRRLQQIDEKLKVQPTESSINRRMEIEERLKVLYNVSDRIEIR